MKIALDMPDNIMAITNVFYTKEEDGTTKIWSWTVAPKDGIEYYVVNNPDGEQAIVENINSEEIKE